jgi:hypothetical protein
MGENEIYLKDERVEDPLARVCFPRARGHVDPTDVVQEV